MSDIPDSRQRIQVVAGLTMQIRKLGPFRVIARIDGTEGEQVPFDIMAGPLATALDQGDPQSSGSERSATGFSGRNRPALSLQRSKRAQLENGVEARNLLGARSVSR